MLVQIFACAAGRVHVFMEHCGFTATPSVAFVVSANPSSVHTVVFFPLWTNAVYRLICVSQHY